MSMKNYANKEWVLEDSDIELLCPKEYKDLTSLLSSNIEDISLKDLDFSEEDTRVKLEALTNKFKDVSGGLELELTFLDQDDIEYDGSPDTLEESNYIWSVTGVRDFSSKAKDLMSKYKIGFDSFSYVTFG